MKNLMVFLIIIFAGCSVKAPFEIPKDLKQEPFQNIKGSSPSIKTIKIKNFLTLESNLDNIPDDKNVVINLLQPVTLEVFFQMLIEQGINIVADLQSKKNIFDNKGKNIQTNNQTLISMPLYQGSLKNLLKSVQISHGLFFKYENGVLICRKISPAYVKVIMPGIQEKLINLLKSFGVQESFYDEISSRIVFKTDFYTYKTISDYFKNNGYLSLVFFDVMILEKEETKDFKHGFDWSALAMSLNEISKIPLNVSIAGSSDQSYSIKFGNGKLSFESIILSLDSLKSFEVVQSARLSALNGSFCNLDVSQKIPYVESIELSSISNSTDKISQGYKFNTVSSGLVLKIKPTVIDNIISVLFNAKLQSVNEFLEVGSTDQQIKQPVVSTRSLNNQVVFNAGETALIGGLKYKKGGFNKSSLSWLKKGFEINETRTFLVSIIIKSEVVRYVFI